MIAQEECRCVVRTHAGRCDGWPSALPLLLIGLLLGTLNGCGGAKTIADSPTEPTSPSPEALVYTDNSPGAVILANALLQSLRRSGRATVVTTDEAEFVKTLPEKQWTSVLVVARFTPPTPAYHNPLQAYAHSGGRAELYLWRDDPNAPAASGSSVLAPTVICIWEKDRTSTTYALCSDAPKTGITSGYTLGDFGGTKPGSLLAVVEPPCAPLKAGSYAACNDRPAAGGETYGQYVQAINAARKQRKVDGQMCSHVHGGNTQAEPPVIGDATALVDCVLTADGFYAQRVAAETRRYKLLTLIAAKQGH